MKTYIFALLYFLFISFYSFAQTKSRGIPASPYPFKANQPDGSLITLIQKGDGVVHWFETSDGYSVLKTKDGWFQYASLNDVGDMVCSGVTVGESTSGVSSLKTAQKRIKKHLRFSSKQIKRKKLNYFGEESRNKSSRKDAFPASGTRRVLLILAEFDDLAHNVAHDKFNNLMNQQDYNGTGSFRDYYLEASYNKLDITTTTTVWVKVPKEYAYYGKNDEEGDDTNPQEFIRDAVDAAEAQGVDFSQFDNDGDGYVDAVQVIHAGYGEEAGADDNTIWSHAWGLGTSWAVKYDGVWINRYVTFPELRNASGADITNIGVICHEFGHGLGLPDYYDTSDDGDYAGEAAGLRAWDIMASGSWNNGGATPAHHNAYSKSLLGWLALEEFDKNGEFSINNLASYPEAYIIHSKTENEFFVLENRQQKGFDSYIPYHGMLIYHVDKNFQGWNDNNVNSDADHEGMDLLEADNSDVLNYYNDYYSDPFPGNASVTVFGDNTFPGSLSWSGEKSDIAINNISEKNNVISFDFRNTSVVLAVLSEEKTINIYPNPTNGLVYIEGSFSPEAVIKVVNQKGEILFSKKVNNPVEGNDAIERIDLGNLLSGIYNILIIEEDKKILKRIIVR